MKECLIKCLSTYVPFLMFLIMIETRDDAGVDRPDKSALFSANEVDIRSISRRAYQHNKKDTIGRKCHRCNARPGCAFPQRYFADRETLCQEFCRACSSLDRGRTPCKRHRMGTLHAPGARTPFGHGAGGRVWQGRRREEESGRGGRTFALVGALMSKIPHFCRHHLLPWRAPIADFSCVCGDPGLSKCYANIRSSVFAPPNRGCDYYMGHRHISQIHNAS